jgi:hypothetical protein
VRRRRAEGLVTDWLTVALGGAAAGTTAAVVGGEIARVWRKGSAPLPQETDNVLPAAAEAVVETAEVAKEGYKRVPTRENTLFNLLSSFVLAFLSARFTTYVLRRRKRWGPFRHVRLGRRHIHHYVPGIALAFVAGTAAILVRSEELEAKLALPFGAGMGLTLDESALLLELDDVYWTREGLLSVQITLAVTAMLAAIALGLRFLRRGEEVVLESSP